MTPVLRAPRFWWRRHSLTGYALAPLGFLYGRATGARMQRSGTRVAVPVICVGNLVVGGAGKTPTALAIAELCRKCGLVPGFLTRGYRGTERGPLVVSREVHDSRAVGDEALLLARSGRTVVAADRLHGAKLLSELDVDIIIMDDGFQNPAIEKDLSIVVLDAERGTGNGRVFPAGPLRAPLLTQIRRADALVVIGRSGTGDAAIRTAARAGLPIIRAAFEPAGKRLSRKKTYLAFAGIADPAKFYASLTAAGANVGAHIDFPDHHDFTDADCERILRRAAERDLVPITTEKDFVRLAGRGGSAAKLVQATQVFRVRIAFEEPRRLLSLIHGVVAEQTNGAMKLLNPQRRPASASSRSRETVAST